MSRHPGVIGPAGTTAAIETLDDEAETKDEAICVPALAADGTVETAEVLVLLEEADGDDPGDTPADAPGDAAGEVDNDDATDEASDEAKLTGGFACPDAAAAPDLEDEDDELDEELTGQL